MLCRADDQTANDIDDQNEDACDGITAHELRRTVHGAIKVGFLSELVTALLGRLLIYNARVEIRVNRHLLAWHGIQSEARDDLGYPASPFSHHDEVDDHQDQENDETDDIVTGNHKLTKRLDDFTRRIGASMPFHEHDSGGGHVQPQPKQGGDQQDRWEG